MEKFVEQIKVVVTRSTTRESGNVEAMAIWLVSFCVPPALITATVDRKTGHFYDETSDAFIVVESAKLLFRDVNYYAKL